MANDIEQIAPTPWKSGAQDSPFHGYDAQGILVFVGVGSSEGASLRRDRIIACVNFCEGLSMQELAQSRPCMGWGRKETKQQSQPPADAGFAQVSALVKGLAQVSQLPGAK
jgi:hypothetical protein